MRRSFCLPPAGPSMRRARRAPWPLLLPFLLLPAVPATSSQQPGEGKGAPPTLASALAEAERLLASREYPAAVESGSIPASTAPP
ncbi:MAG TPA: hypothetical protein VHQ90_18775 [Thermoanaerobaculia bacterium]|nr:hypothetical protein [Thermoanaerobaculia bacterium]